jgi:hypothetical protein
MWLDIVVGPIYAAGMKCFLVVLAISSAAAAAEPDFVLASVNLNGCSGTIIARGKLKAYGLSCEHCCRVGKEFDFTCSDGTTKGVGRWLAEDDDLDLAIFVCWSKDTIGAVKLYRTLPVGRVVACGFPGGKGPAKKTLVPVSNTVISNLPGRRYRFDVKAGHFAGGDSGGGVFIGDGLISVMSHGEDDDEAFGSQHSDLVAVCERWQKKATEPLIAKGDPPAEGDRTAQSKMWGDKDRTAQILAIWKAIEKAKQAGPAGKAGPAGDRGIPGPAGQPVDPAVVAELRKQIADQKKLIDQIRSTPITVQVLDPKSGKVIVEKAYPFGTPVRLVLPTMKE